MKLKFIIPPELYLTGGTTSVYNGLEVICKDPSGWRKHERDSLIKNKIYTITSLRRATLSSSIMGKFEELNVPAALDRFEHYLTLPKLKLSNYF